MRTRVCIWVFALSIGLTSAATVYAEDVGGNVALNYELEDWQLGPGVWPVTCDEAADDALNLLSEKDKEIVRATPRNELIRFYRPGWGLTIRNRQGLWRGNTALIISCCGNTCWDPESASMVIIERAWEKLQ